MPTPAPVYRALPAELEATVEAARSYRRAARSKNTRRGYAADLRGFATWAEAHGLATLPADPATIGLYIAHLATTGRKPSTISRAVAAISITHKEAGLRARTPTIPSTESAGMVLLKSRSCKKKDPGRVKQEASEAVPGVARPS